MGDTAPTYRRIHQVTRGLGTTALAGALALWLGCAPELGPGCPPGLTQCGSACVDTSGDPAHCGRCDHDCLGGSCAASMCQPILLDSGPPQAFDVAVDATGVYWTSEGLSCFAGAEMAADGAVRRVPLREEGPPTPLASDQPAPRGLAIDDTNVYWTDCESGAVMMAPKAGGTAALVAMGQGEPRDIAVDKAHVYWTTFLGGEVMKAPIGPNSAAVPLFAGSIGPDGIATDAGHIYWVNRASGEIVKLTKEAPNTATVLFADPPSASDGPSDIVVDATHVYWTNVEEGKISKVSIDGEGGEIMLAYGEHDPLGIAVDATDVYWVNYGGGEVRKISKEGGEPATLAGGQAGPRRIALDSRAIYWTNFESGQLMMLAK